MDSEIAGHGDGAAVGAQSLLQPFLSKCYAIVDDPATDRVVSWSETNESFVIWDTHAFSKLLPNYFKHDNFSSFVRQLNVYGFHKVDPEKWEFANEGFIKGQKHLMKNIARKKNSSSPFQQQQQPPQTKKPNEIGSLALKNEVDILRRDKNLLMQELVKLGQQQKNSSVELCTVGQRIRDMELNQQQMMSFLAMAVQSPATLAELVQQTCNSWWRTDMSKIKQLPAPCPTVSENSESSADWQIISYTPPSSMEDEVQSCLPELFPNLANECPIVDDIDLVEDTADMAVDSIVISEEDMLSTEYIEYLLSSPAS